MDGEWVRHAIRWSLIATAHTPYPIDDVLSIKSEDNEAGDEREKKFIEGILYSRQLILTYRVVILGVLLVVTVIHWARNGRRAWRRRQGRIGVRKQDTEGDVYKSYVRADQGNVTAPEGNRHFLEDGDSSSSSTLSGTATPPDHRKWVEHDAETTPLLPQSRQATRSPLSWARAWLMYQPKPLPLVNKILPSNGTTVSILAFLSLNFFYLFFRVPLTIPTLFIFADRAALVFVANLPLLYILAAKNQPIRWLTGYSYENLNIFHRRLGELLCLLALLHSVGMTGVWYTLLRPTGFTLARFLLSKIIILGLGAFVAYELLYLTSLSTIRQRWYELFLVLHVALQIAALVLVFFHHSNSRPYVLAALAIFLTDRLVFRLALKTRQLRAHLSVLPDQSTALVSANWQIQTSLQGRLGRTLSGVGSNIKQGWFPTAHVFLTIPSLSRKHLVQAHPFTIASAAPTSPSQSTYSAANGTHAWLSFIIRAQDGFSADLLRYARTHSTTMIRVDGPYGSRHALELLQDADTAIVVAGGSGIAVAYPLVWALLIPPMDRSDVTDTETMGLTSAHLERKKKVCLIWIVHERSHISWIGEERLDELRELGCDVVIPDPTAEAGRPDVAELVEKSVMRRECGSEKARGRIGVVCSGPDGMNRDVRNVCAGMVGRGWDVDVVVEKFGW